MKIDGADETESIKNTMDPNWQIPITIHYRALSDKIKLRVFDKDLGKDDLVGEVSVTVNDLIRPFNRTRMQYNQFTLSMSGALEVLALTQADKLNSLQLSFSASKLPKMDTFGKCDPYFEIFLVDSKNMHSYDNAIKLYSSKVIKKTLNPEVSLNRILQI